MEVAAIIAVALAIVEIPEAVLACAALAAISAYWLASQTVSRELTVE